MTIYANDVYLRHICEFIETTYCTLKDYILVHVFFLFMLTFIFAYITLAYMDEYRIDILNAIIIFYLICTYISYMGIQYAIY